MNKNFNQLLSLIRSYNSKADFSLINRAFQFAVLEGYIVNTPLV